MWQHRVMVSAKRDSRHSTAHAINVFDEVHQYFLHTLNSEEQCLTRLLVPAAHAKKFFVFHTLKAYPCTLSIYLADNLSVFSPGDVIFDAEGERRGVREAVQSMLFYLGEFAVDEQKLSEYKAGNGIRPSPYEICTSRIVYNGPRAERKHETVDSSRIAVSHIDHIIGKDGTMM
ncbi:unnamed protein product [Cuscuta campestris]|uniref:Uncharacterized protein n=1 Tax=Cuscuta campestris TaxID=132261 RepID=A0A484K0U1_9ASTE|nr:unnamed protein product [Cuscuta campestris]